MANRKVRAAGIDLGSNSFRLLIAEVGPASLLPLAKKLITVRLGEGLGAGGSLAGSAMERGIHALADFREELDRHVPQYVRACGTHALRVAANRDHFLRQAEAELQSQVNVISGQEEAGLTAQGVCFAMGAAATSPALIADVGGGSTEFILPGAETKKTPVISLPLGAVRLSEKFAKSFAADGDLEPVRTYVRQQLQSSLASLPIQTGLDLIGSGGTATSLAALDMRMRVYDEQQVQGHRIGKAGLAAMVESLMRLTPTARNGLPGLADRRGEIIVAGALILQELLASLAAETMRVSDAGLLEGIVLSALPETLTV